MAKRLEINVNPSVSCPDLKECTHRTTKNYFKYFCACKGHLNCFHFNRKRDQLKPPIQWIQHMAMQGFQPRVEAKPRKGQTDLRRMK